MLPLKPYIINAFYDWISDSKFTPYIEINTEAKGVEIPLDFIQDDGKITLNISSLAVQDLQITNKHVFFQASFSGVVHEIYAPIAAVMAIFAKENGHGTTFEEYECEEDELEDEYEEEFEGEFEDDFELLEISSFEDEEDTSSEISRKKKKHLRIIK